MRTWVALLLLAVVVMALEERREEREEREGGGRTPQEGGAVERKVTKMKKTGTVCPGRCVGVARQCRGGRVLRAASCGEGVCCVSASKRTGEEQAESKKKKKKKRCKSRKPCKEVWGTCTSRKTGCAKKETTLSNSKGKRFCTSNGCVCCTKEAAKPECVAKKCSQKKGYCTADKTSCQGRIGVSKALCSGEGCVCCLPAKPCKTKPECEHKGGTCGNLKTLKCATKPLVGKQYCGGQGCGCCVPEEEEEPFKWGYEETNGPAVWPANFPKCAGKRQSPVALVSADAVGTNPFIPFKFNNYRQIPTKTLLINNGHTAMAMIEQEETPSIAGGDLEGDYTFLQYHFHWGKDKTEGSEHTIDGRKFPGEIHLVHYKTSYGTVAEALKHEDGIAVLGIMLEVSYEDNPKLKPVIEQLSRITKADTEVEISPMPLQNLLPRNVMDFFRYEGSLTTPTCNEIVIWTVFKDTITISHKQLAMFRTLEDDHGNLLVENFRPVQPLNGREVEMGRISPYWSYVPPFGPPNWPKSFPRCGSDVRQSPVALVTKDAIGDFPRINLGFKNYDTVPENMTIFNNGHTAQAMPTFAGGAVATIQGGDLDEKYQVLQFHFHWGSVDTLGSEHVIDGKVFPLEIHIVHWKSSYGSVAEALRFGDGIAVLGIMVTISNEDNPRLQPVIDALAAIHEAEEETELHPFPLAYLLPQDTQSFFRYEGSLTTPTCNEIVIWTVFTDTIHISSKQLAEFRKLMDEGGMILQNNFRPPQPLNGREVLFGSRTAHWSYVGATGPKNWPLFFPKCGGDRQSPVALVASSAKPISLPSFTFTNYDKVPTGMTIMNNGHTAQFMLESAHVPMVKGGGLDGSYTFLQFHFHWGKDDTLGSEHTIDGKRFPAELHLVHYKTSYGTVAEALKHEDGIAVLGIMLEVTNTDNLKLKNVIDALPKVHEADTEDTSVPFALGNLIPSNTKNFFRYKGSLTTPTCNEIVIWTVFKDTITISHKQIEEFRKLEDDSGLLLVDNFRPLQDLKGREVQMI